jgi:hypothetical protein
VQGPGPHSRLENLEQTNIPYAIPQHYHGWGQFPSPGYENVIPSPGGYMPSYGQGYMQGPYIGAPHSFVERPIGGNLYNSFVPGISAPSSSQMSPHHEHEDRVVSP